MLFNERRTDTRISAEYHVEIEIDGTSCAGKTRNLSIRGVLARIESGEPSKDMEGAQGTCLIANRNNRKSLLNIRVMRVAGQDIAAIFVDLDFEQDLFLRGIAQDG